MFEVQRQRQYWIPTLLYKVIRGRAVANLVRGGRVVRCRTCDREVAHGCCIPTPTQRAIPPGSVNEY